MDTTKWQESIDVGIEEVDQQHQRLILTIQELEDSIKIGKNQGIFREALEELIDYIDFHFKTEERVFQITNYPDAKNHIKKHRAFIHKINEFKSDYENGRLELYPEMIKAFGDWARSHMGKEDKKYAEFIAKQHHR